MTATHGQASNPGRAVRPHLMRRFILLLSFLGACSPAVPRAEVEPAPRVEPLPPPLVDAREFVDGGFVGDELGWFFVKSGARTDRVMWSKVPTGHAADAPCAKLEGHECKAALGGARMAWPSGMADATCVEDVSQLERRFAWPIEGSGRLLLLDKEALIAERRPDCLATAPVRQAWPVRGEKTIERSGEAPRIALFAEPPPDPTLSGVTLVATETDLPSLELPGGVLVPFGGAPGDEDKILCISEGQIAGLRELDPDIQIAPPRHKVSATWRGGERVEVLELRIAQSCEGDPSLREGAENYEREVRWVLERHGASWRQIELEVQNQQSSSGDGASMSLSRRERVNTWVVGAMALVGRWSETSSNDSGHYSSRYGVRTTLDWWLVPAGLLAEGFDELAFDGAGMRLTPKAKEPERKADQTFESGNVPIGRCVLALGGERASLKCGDREVSVEPMQKVGTLTHQAQVWDLGTAFYVVIELSREQKWTEEPEDDDSMPSERTSFESQGLTVIVSKSGTAMREVGGSGYDSSM